MAYKNMKKNKRHIKMLRLDPTNWRNLNKKRLQRKSIAEAYNDEIIAKDRLKYMLGLT